MTPEQALRRAQARPGGLQDRVIALLGVPLWLSALLPLHVTLGEGIPTWHAPPGPDARWLNARTMLTAAAELWPDEVAACLQGRVVHSPYALGRLSWRPGEHAQQGGPKRLATLLRDACPEHLDP